MKQLVDRAPVCWSTDKGSDRAIGWLQEQLPKLVLAPSFTVIVLFVYGFILWTVYLSFSASRMLPNYSWAGLSQWERLWNTLTWQIALDNLAVFSALYIILCLVIGLALAILLDQKIRIEGRLRTLYLYPMALSFIVTGTAWKWFLNPGLGLERSLTRQCPALGGVLAGADLQRADRDCRDLPGTPVRDGGDLAQVAGRDSFRQHDGAAHPGDLRALDTGLELGLPGAGMFRHQGVLLEQHQDGGAGGGNLRPAGRV
jgi:hypothetical protein